MTLRAQVSVQDQDFPTESAEGPVLVVTIQRGGAARTDDLARLVFTEDRRNGKLAVQVDLSESFGKVVFKVPGFARADITSAGNPLINLLEILSIIQAITQQLKI